MSGADGARHGRFARLPMAAVFDARVQARTLHVLAALASYADAAGYCYPSQGTVARRLGMGRRTVQRHLDLLGRLGYVTSHRRIRPDGKGGYAASAYVLSFPPLIAQGRGLEPRDDGDGEAGSGKDAIGAGAQPGPIASDAPRHDASQGDRPSRGEPQPAMRQNLPGDAPTHQRNDAPCTGARTIPMTYPKKELAHVGSARKRKGPEGIDWDGWKDWIEFESLCDGWPTLLAAIDLAERSGLSNDQAQARVDSILKRARKQGVDPVGLLRAELDPAHARGGA